MNIKMLGVVLIVLGVAGLFFGHFGYTETKPVLDAGPIHVKTQEEHYFNVPTIAGIVVLLAGVTLIFVDRRSA